MATAFAVAGLTNGTAYTFTVTATTSLGTSVRKKMRTSGSGATWRAVKRKGDVHVWKTKGTRHTRWVNPRAGTYRVRVKKAHGYRGASSRSLRLSR